MKSQNSGHDFLARQLRIGLRRDVELIAVILLAMFAAFVAYVARLNAVTHDAFHEMALVREWFRTGVFPTSDVWSFSPTVSPAVHHEWATGLALYWSAGDSPLGIHGFMALRMALICALWIILYRVARNGGCHPLVFAVLAPVTFPFLWVGFATVRAQLFTLVFLALQLLFLQADWRGRKNWVLAWFVLFVVWLNMHAGFVVGSALMIAHLVERVVAILNRDGLIDSKRPWILRVRELRLSTLVKAFSETWHLLVMIPACFALTFCNPWVDQYLPYLIRAITMPRPTMLEWQPLWKTYSSDLTMIAYGLAVVLMVYAAWQRRWARLRGWMFCALAAVMALKHIRHGSLFAVLWIAIVPSLVSSTPLGHWIVRTVVGFRRQSIILATVATIACGVFAFVHPFWLATLPRTLEDVNVAYPVGAVDYLKHEGFQGNMLTPFQSGAYVSWRLYPDVRVSFDGRYEVAYQDHVLPDHNIIYRADPGWSERLASYDADLILVSRLDPVCQPLMEQSRGGERVDTSSISKSSPDWELFYEDESFLVFGRRGLSLPYADGRGNEILDAF